MKEKYNFQRQQHLLMAYNFIRFVAQEKRLKDGKYLLNYIIDARKIS